MRRYAGSLALLGVLLAVSAPSALAKPKTEAPPIKTFQGTKEEQKEDRRAGAAKMEVPTMRREATGLADEKREAQITTLAELIDMTDDTSPEKPEYLERMAGLFWEKSESFEKRAYSNELEQQMFAAQEANNEQEAQRLKAIQESYFDQQRKWQNQAVEMYKEIEQKFPTYKDLDMVLYYLGYNLNLMVQGDQALQYYVKIARSFPNSRYLPDALFNIGDYYFDMNQFDNALIFYEKVERFPDSLVFGYAKYKKGWALYNMGEYEKALGSFLQVIKYTNEMEAAGRPLPIELRREAQKDLVTTYSQIGTADKALPFFRGFAPDIYLELGATLAELYSDQGRFDESNRLLQHIIKADPKSHRVLMYQRIIVKNAKNRGNKKNTAQEAERLVQLYQTVGPTAPPEFVREERGRIDELIRELATTWHKESETAADQAEARESARRLYGVYLNLFPDTSEAYVMHRNYAVLLYQEKRWEEAAAEFEKVLQLDAQGEYTESAAYQSLMCYLKLSEAKTEVVTKKEEDDLRPKELGEFNTRFISAVDRYAKIAGARAEEDDLVAAQAKAGIMLYEHNRFDDSVARFKDIVRLHENHPLARDAARFMLSALSLTHNIRALTRWAEAISQRPALMAGDLVGIIQRIRDQAEFNKCFDYEVQKLYVQAADCFVSYTEKFPDTLQGDKALYNAAVNYQKAKMMQRTLEAYLRLVQQRAKSPLAPKAMFAIGQTFRDMAVYSEAAKFYEAYVERYPKHDYVEEALARAALFRKSLGASDPAQYDLALKDYDLYVKKFPKNERLPEVVFDQGNILELQGKYEEAIRHFDKVYIAKWGKRGPLDLLFLAHLKVGLLYRKTKARNAEELATEWFKKAVQAFETLTPEQMQTVTARGLAAVAEAKFAEGEVVLLRYQAVKFTDKNLQEATQEKIGILKQAQDIFGAVYGYQHPSWQIAALNRMGMAWEDFADSIENAPVPKTLKNQMQREEYKQFLADQAKPMRDKAVEMYRKAIETANQEHWYNRFSEEAEQRLAKLDFEFRFTKEFRARPSYSFPNANPVTFRFKPYNPDEQKGQQPSGGAK